MFGLASIAVIGVVGLAIDVSRQANASAATQSLVDSVALGLAREASGMDAAQLNLRAQQIYNGLAANGAGAGYTVQAVYTASPVKTLTVSLSGNMPSVFGMIYGVSNLPVKAGATVPLSSRPAQIALVLDNTGSMNGSGKLAALKTASANLVTAMQTASQTSGNEVKIAVVPFAKSVKIGPGYSSAPWLDWSYYHGSASSWHGCVDDRDQPNDTNSRLPDDDDSETWYPASNCNLAPILPLTNDWSALQSRIAELTATSTTNLTIGLQWGFNMLTHGAPLSTASNEPGKYSNYIILLTDGDNTQNRWSRSSATIDQRTREACRTIKSAGIQIFAVRVVNGNESLLRECASRADMYYNVNDPADLNAVFDRIGNEVKSALFLSK